ncbi:MAG: HD domain-containing protein [Candidatus Nitrospinota bacterium M3_3B_026]
MSDGIWMALFMGLMLMAFAPLSLMIPSRKESSKRRIALERISGLWSKRKETALRIEEIARLWRADMQAVEESIEHAHFENVEIKRFYEAYIDGRPYFNGAAGEVAQELLKLLDREGECPSVVGTEGDPEASLEKNTFDILAKVPLYMHTIHVAEEMIGENETGPSVVKSVIAALAHDIGKLPSYRKSGYSLGDHPLFSVTALETIPQFKKLTYAKEILQAVRDHHGRSRDTFSQSLREADQRARRQELADHARSSNEEESVAAVASGISALEKTSSTPSQVDKAAKTKTEKPGEVDLPWFSPARFFEILKPRVNRMEGGRWVAFSMSDGYVYVQAKAMWEAAEALGKEVNDGLIAMAAADEELRRGVLLTVVNRLRGYGVIAEDLIREGYFGGEFVVRMRDGKTLKGFYTPFRAEAFAETVSELEAIKEGKIRDIVDVSPKYE